jgi:hypothetical protein
MRLFTIAHFLLKNCSWMDWQNGLLEFFAKVLSSKYDMVGQGREK